MADRRHREFWTEARIAALGVAAAEDKPAAVIATAFGISTIAIVRKCMSLEIPFRRYTPEEEIEHARMLKEREDRNNAARNAKKKDAQRAVGTPSGMSRTSPAYRARLAPAREMTKGELRRVLTQAVENTARMQVDAG